MCGSSVNVAYYSGGERRRKQPPSEGLHVVYTRGVHPWSQMLVVRGGGETVSSGRRLTVYTWCVCEWDACECVCVCVCVYVSVGSVRGLRMTPAAPPRQPPRSERTTPAGSAPFHSRAAHTHNTQPPQVRSCRRLYISATPFPFKGASHRRRLNEIASCGGASLI